MAIDISNDDLKMLCEALSQGAPIDPELAERIHRRAMKAREEVFKERGHLDVAVKLIREARDE